jgi:hypothetical protein
MYGFDGNGSMFSYDLTTPFECSSVTSGNPTRTVALQTLLGLAAPSYQIAFTSDGAIGFVAQVGTQPVGGGNACQITQFTLSTPFNISTIDAGTAVSTTISGVNYSYQSGINVADSNSKLYFSAFNTSWAVRMYEYTFTS